MKEKEAIPRHKRYQGLVKYFTQGEAISSWLRNLESILKDENIPDEDDISSRRRNLESTLKD